MTDRSQALQAIAISWLRLEQAHLEVEELREEFLDALLNGASLGITQKDMASQCINNEGHISRSRIAQYLSQIRNV